ncbi:MAG: glycosyltransferase family 2 protein [Synergistaceae bacterium]|nr:glycosyltransferase family 2 protein [Synergistaceae bacterium]
MQKKLSVLIPAYNVEKYLRKCVESVINQTYKNIEIIIVDDGSRDKTPKICNELADKYNNIKVIHQENQGTGKAREACFKASTGEYITYIDPDDYIDTAAYGKVIKVLEDNDCDIVQFGYYEVSPDGEIIKERRRKPAIFNNAHDVFEYYSTEKDGTWMVWDKVYKRGMFDNIEWLKVTGPEDWCISVQLFAKVKKFMTIDELFYYYLINPAGYCLQPMTDKKREDMIKAHDFIIKVTENNFPEFLPEALNRRLEFENGCCMFYMTLLKDVDFKVLQRSAHDTLKTYKRLQTELKKRGNKGSDEVRYNFKQLARIWLCKYCPALAVAYLKVRLKIHDLTGL